MQLYHALSRVHGSMDFFNSFETYRARVVGPVGLVGGGDEDGAALPRVGDLALVAHSEGRGREEGALQGGGGGDVPRSQARPDELGRVVERVVQRDHLSHLPPS